eukprot:TRINITY_DN9108_c0_g1_i1.p1 TRINITY_DN9108_c0_g1~~TRINITY_DN9108_c0_g1_i1.p1  ORF type:complete len:140 (-),score=7.22 TRINITY_DN9108_c0_g1_i1:47-424(-)
MNMRTVFCTISLLLVSIGFTFALPSAECEVICGNSTSLMVPSCCLAGDEPECFYSSRWIEYSDCSTELKPACCGRLTKESKNKIVVASLLIGACALGACVGCIFRTCKDKNQRKQSYRRLDLSEY